MQFAVPDWLEHHHSTVPLQADADAELEDEWLNPTEVTLEVSNCQKYLLSIYTAARWCRHRAQRSTICVAALLLDHSGLLMLSSVVAD
jgi:hypothetical protein